MSNFSWIVSSHIFQQVIISGNFRKFPLVWESILHSQYSEIVYEKQGSVSLFMMNHSHLPRQERKELLTPYQIKARLVRHWMKGWPSSLIPSVLHSPGGLFTVGNANEQYLEKSDRWDSFVWLLYLVPESKKAHKNHWPWPGCRIGTHGVRECWLIGSQSEAYYCSLSAELSLEPSTTTPASTSLLSRVPHSTTLPVNPVPIQLLVRVSHKRPMWRVQS